MKFTSEDLMKAMGLAVGDKVIINNNKKPSYEVIKEQNIHKLKSISLGTIHPLYYLINTTFEILPRPKRVGDLKCGEYGEHNCASCPIRAICVSDEYNDETLYSKLELSHKFAKDQEIYELLKARLDKEVEQ